MELLRAFAAAAALAVGAAAGYRKKCSLRSRAEFLSETEQLLARFAAETGYSARTSDELLERENGQFARSVKMLRDECGDLREAWKRACEKLPEGSRERALLNELGRSLGTADRESAVAMLERCKEEFTGLKTEAESEYSGQGKAMLRVGTLCGIGAAILLI